MNKTHKKTFCFDIDGVIMSLTNNNDYSSARPIESVVKIINNLYEQGHHIILFTARGYITKIDWQGLTCKQLKEAGVCYHELKFGKPAADYYIDDRMISLESLKDKIATKSL